MESEEKPDISTLEKTGHLYFGPTPAAVFDPRENPLRPRLVRDRLIAPFWGLSREVGV